ncbi:MAG TPA: ABC transporter permease [Steroidobacteraceae bacterium]|nr:ABC transporter permease [Steroidobacteraceae bacterium]
MTPLSSNAPPSPLKIQEANASSSASAFLYALQECLRSALSSIRAHGLRSFLTMLGIIIGVGSVICVISLLQGLTDSVMNEFQGMGANTLVVVPVTSREDYLRGKYNRLKTADVEMLAYRVDGISNVTPMMSPRFGGGVRNGDNAAAAQIYATTPYYQFVQQVFPKHGRFITASDDATRRRVVVLGEQARIDLKLPENPVGQFIQIGREWFKVVGVMEPRGGAAGMFGQSPDNYVVMPYQTGVTLSGQATPPDIQILLTVDDLESVESTKSRITQMLRRQHKIDTRQDDDFRVESSESMAKTVERISGMITLVVSAVVGISLIVGGVGIMNIMLVSVTERTREIGIAKALGAPRRFILMQFLIEAVVLAVIGGIIGIAFGFMLGFGAASAIPNFPSPAVPWWAIAGATGFSALVGVLFGILPASKAANLTPIDALRHE